MIDIRLLGPVAAWRDGIRLDLGPRKQRFVFAVLALEPNRFIAVDRLVDLTWPRCPPRTAVHAIHVCISRLRAALGPGAGVAHLLTEGRSYMLRLGPSSIDTERFRLLVARARGCARDETRVALLRRALLLWRGAALADAGTPDVTDRLTRGLAEDRLTALEACLEAELRLGRHRAVLGELTDLVHRHPYRQRLVAQLMLAQYRAGSPADALASFRAARDLLACDLGLDPAPGLRDLEVGILRGDERLELPVAG